MALVGRDPFGPREFYEVVEWSQPTDPWVQQHVIPVLGKAPITKPEFQYRLELFLNRSSRLEVIADWPEDIKHFCDALIIAPGRRMWHSDTRIKFDVRFNLPSTAISSKVPHNALEDARALARALKWIS